MKLVGGGGLFVDFPEDTILSEVEIAILKSIICHYESAIALLVACKLTTEELERLADSTARWAAKAIASPFGIKLRFVPGKAL